MSSLAKFKQEKPALILRYAHSDNRKGLVQVVPALAALAFFWWAAAWSSHVSYWLCAGAGIFITLFTTRLFVLMHDCGHGCLFRSRPLNRRVGFLLGVIVGLPQYVWSKRHAFHHVTNGNWQRFRGVLGTLTVEEYAGLSKMRQQRYRWLRNVVFAPYGGFMYMVYRPRMAWACGSLDFMVYVLRRKVARPAEPLRRLAAGFRTKYWRNPIDYRYMCWNNVVSLGVWACMCWAVGPVVFFAVYFISLSLVGGFMILLVNSQHNSKHAYAADSAHWDCDAGILYGTSFMIWPSWINWFTANTAYHHVHHVCAAIPNYSLAECHEAYRHPFADVVRVRLAQIPDTLKYILWDSRAQRIISVAEYEQQTRQSSVAAAPGERQHRASAAG